jgi:hypothetical protein
MKLRAVVAALIAIVSTTSLSQLAAAQAQITMPGLGQVTIDQPPVPPPPGYGQAPTPYDRRAAHKDLTKLSLNVIWTTEKL